MNRKYLLGIVAFIIAALIAAVFTLNNPDDTVLATVNGESITLSDLNKELMTVPADGRELINDSVVLDFLITKRLLLQQAASEGITLDEEQFAEILAAKEKNHGNFNLTIEEYRKRLREDELINQVVEKSKKAFILRNEDVQDVYERLYKPRNISFEKAEPEIIVLLKDEHERQSRNSYIQQLRDNAEITNR